MKTWTSFCHMTRSGLFGPMTSLTNFSKEGITTTSQIDTNFVFGCTCTYTYNRLRGFCSGADCRCTQADATVVSEPGANTRPMNMPVVHARAARLRLVDLEAHTRQIFLPSDHASFSFRTAPQISPITVTTADIPIYTLIQTWL
jgi:hypothetical protein